MAEGGQASAVPEPITTTVVEEKPEEHEPALVLKLGRPSTKRKEVKWTSETVDNEEMNKKKSKCCCIYKKPRMFGESSDESGDEDGCTSNCHGHKKKCYRHDDHADKDSAKPDENGASASS